MKFDRKFLVNAHNDIKADMAAIGLEPHHSLQHLINTRSTYGCNFYTLRYWRSKDTAWMTDHWYNQSCLELLVYNNRLFIGIWFGKNNKELMKLKSHDHDIIEKSNEYSGYTWVDENETPAPANENLIKWLCESGHETAFRKELSNCNRDVVISEMKHLKEYLDILLNRN